VAKAWHFVQLVGPPSAECAFESWPGEICAGAGAKSSKTKHENRKHRVAAAPERKLLSASESFLVRIAGLFFTHTS
jgi:hypothetical protein